MESNLLLIKQPIMKTEKKKNHESWFKCKCGIVNIDLPKFTFKGIWNSMEIQDKVIATIVTIGFISMALYDIFY